MPESLILLPGLLNDERLWAHQMAQLADLAEIKVADLVGPDTIGAMAERVLVTRPGPFALAGLSMGGYVAFDVMRRAPERVSRLALLDTSARPDTPEQSARRRGLIELARKGRFLGVTPRLLPQLLHPDHVRDRTIANTVVQMARSVGREGFIAQQRAIMARPDSRPDLARIKCPTLVLGGQQDAITPPEVLHEIAAGIAGAELRLIDHCGHLAPLEQPEAVTAALADWLRAGRGSRDRDPAASPG
jgi:pimeloyl-ACP methyl ester carboxylesterase